MVGQKMATILLLDLSGCHFLAHPPLRHYVHCTVYSVQCTFTTLKLQKRMGTTKLTVNNHGQSYCIRAPVIVRAIE